MEALVTAKLEGAEPPTAGDGGRRRQRRRPDGGAARLGGPGPAGGRAVGRREGEPGLGREERSGGAEDGGREEARRARRRPRRGRRPRPRRRRPRRRRARAAGRLSPARATVPCRGRSWPGPDPVRPGTFRGRPACCRLRVTRGRAGRQRRAPQRAPERRVTPPMSTSLQPPHEAPVRSAGRPAPDADGRPTARAAGDGRPGQPGLGRADRPAPPPRRDPRAARPATGPTCRRSPPWPTRRTRAPGRTWPSWCGPGNAFALAGRARPARGLDARPGSAGACSSSRTALRAEPDPRGRAARARRRAGDARPGRSGPSRAPSGRARSRWARTTASGAAARLVAMAGERLRPPGWTEISAVCTDEEHRGQGLATRLIRHARPASATAATRRSCTRPR